MSGPVLHHRALGIHPSAFVGNDPPITTELQDHVLWINTSVGPPFQLKMWDVATAQWLDIGAVSIGSGGTMELSGDCLSFPIGALLCNPSTDLVTLVTPTGTHQWDATGYTSPGLHRLEQVRA